MSADTEQDLVYTVGPRGVITVAAMAVASVTAALVAGLLIVGSAPVDYRFVTVVVGFMFVAMVLVAAMSFSILGRKEVRYTPVGIGAGQTIKWSDVRSVDAVSTLAGYRVRVTHGQTSIDLLAPAGLWWRQDERFRREFAEIRAYARRHGAALGPATSPRSAGNVIKLAMLVALVVVGVSVAGVRVAQRGWILPSTPQATNAIDACRALDAAGLSQFWPPDLRERDGYNAPDGSGYSSCRLTPRPGEKDGRFTLVHATVAVGRANLYTSSETGSREVFAVNCTGKSPSLPPVGDQSCRKSDGVIVARRANVVVTVDVAAADGSSADRTAAILAKRIVAGISLG